MRYEIQSLSDKYEIWDYFDNKGIGVYDSESDAQRVAHSLNATTLIVFRDNKWVDKEIHIFADVLELDEKSDRGMAINGRVEDENSNLYVILQSYDETMKHEDFNKFLNKRVLVTVEVVEG